ncbi:respiratory nitrate reductase subunit gamma [Robertmurraya massiliosenegalensis]|uniref:respiratory nitrate reductase subunit gamma n=1 Tax=Robertmurraya massiliosenegalensis TaxID=1287657 RepID=UPI0003078363|nr:respiratory nitrate reductase subunit gamma [Robertmurraya massiliosenegalensis]
MDLLQIIIWLIYPYVVVAVLGMALIWRVNGRSVQEEMKFLYKLGSVVNRIILVLMALSLLSGIGVVVFYSITGDPEKLFYWVKSLVILDPDLDLIGSISILSQTHFLLLLTMLLALSFSKYIGVLQGPKLLFKRSWSKSIRTGLK